MNQEKITVLMSVYNEPENFLRQAVDSILNQTYRNFEFIIILDKPDNLVADHVLEEYAARDPRIRFYRNDHNIGLAMSLNRGIELAQCEIIARMDADDISMPERFEKEILFLKEHPEVHLVSTNFITIDENGKQTRSAKKLPSSCEEANRLLPLVNLVLHPSVLYYKKDLREIGGYRNFPATQDRDMWLRYFTKGWDMGFVDEVLMMYRLSSNNTSMGSSLKQWTCSKYIRQLFRERQKKGTDTFSEEELRKRLERAGYNNPSSRERFSKVSALLFNARTAINSKCYFRAITNVIRAFFLHKEAPSYIVYRLRLISRSNHIEEAKG